MPAPERRRVSFAPQFAGPVDGELNDGNGFRAWLRRRRRLPWAPEWNPYIMVFVIIIGTIFLGGVFVLTFIFVKDVVYANSITSDPGSLSSSIIGQLPIHGKHWSYEGLDDGQASWKKIYPGCGGSLQSPINIDTSRSMLNNSLRLKLALFDRKLLNPVLENNGHSLQISFSDPIKPFVTGSAVDDEAYVFHHIDFHWGFQSGHFNGSEHSIDGRKGAMELHLQHFNGKYDSYATAMNHTDGLLILAVLCDRITGNKTLSQRTTTPQPPVGEDDDERETHFSDHLSRIIKLIEDVPRYKQAVGLRIRLSLNQFLPRRLVSIPKPLVEDKDNDTNIHGDEDIPTLDSQSKRFYRYRGSLSIPPCPQSVTWIVFHERMTIEESQLRQFSRSLKSESVQDNHRDLQPLNNRTIDVSYLL